MTRANEPRRHELAKIHIAIKQLGMDDETYRAMLWSLARVRSAKDLDAGGRSRVLDHLKAAGFKAKVGTRPHNLDSADRGPLLGKIEALLADAARPWSYADGMAKHMFKVDRLTFCTAEQLHKIVAALVYDANRRGQKTPCK